MTREVSEEMLMAFVDGELAPEAAEDIRRAVAGDIRLARRAEALRASRDLAWQAFAGLKSQPVPRRLTETVMLGTSPPPTAARRQVSLRRSALPIAASLVLAAGIGGYLLGQFWVPEEADLLGGAVLAEAVGATASGEQRRLRIAGREVTVTGIATYPVDGGICRMFEAAPADGEAVRGIGCNYAEGWHIDLAIAIPASNGLAPAASSVAETLDAYLQALEAGPALDRVEEEAIHE